MDTTWILVADSSRGKIFESPDGRKPWREIEEFEHPEGRGARAPAGNVRSAAPDEHRIAEFVRVVAACVKRCVCGTQRRVVRKRAQQIVVAAAWFVCSGENGIDYAQCRPRSDALLGDARARTQPTAERGGMLQRTHDRGSDGDDAAAARSGAADRARGVRGNE